MGSIALFIGWYQSIFLFSSGFFFECLQIYYSCLYRYNDLSQQCLFGLAPNSLPSYYLEYHQHKVTSQLYKQNKIIIIQYQQFYLPYSIFSLILISIIFIIDQHKIMAGKKWCEYCRINLPFDKKAIQQHEATRMHIQNKQKHIKFERIKLQKQEKAKRQISKANNFISTANIPKAKKGSELQKQVEEYRNDIYMSGKMAIHQLIAQKTKGLYGAPIEYPEKQDLVLAQNYQDKDENSNQQNEDQKFQMWKIDICQQTGKPCFINRISQAKSYEPPKGYILSEQQKQEWQDTKKICEEIPDENLQEVGQVGQWQQAQQQDYFEQNRAPSQNQNDQDLNERKQIIKKERQQEIVKEQQNIAKNMPQVMKPSWIDNLQQRIRKNEVTQQQVISTMLTNTLQECRTVKQKNEALKKLIRSDFEIKATLDKNDEELIKMEQEEPKKSIGFKPRKKVKTFQIVQQKDIV